MDQLPARLREAAGDEPVIESVDLGGGDALVVTPGATHVYRAEGLLSDETVESYRHAVDRFAVQERRRKRTLVLESIDGERRFTVPATAADAVVTAVLEGILRSHGVVDPDETVTAQFRFSDLTLVVTDAKLFKHVGPSVWNEDYEMFDYDSLTDLDFEEGSVATQVVLEVQGRQHRVKVPNDRAGRVQRAVQDAVFAHHEVSSLETLREAIGVEETDEDDPEPATSVTEPPVDADEPPDHSGTDWSPPADQDVTGPRGRATSSTEPPVTSSTTDVDAEESNDDTDTSTEGATSATDDAATTSEDDGPDDEAGQPDDVAHLADRVDALEAKLDRQNELLADQTETIEQLVEELRRGR